MSAESPRSTDPLATARVLLIGSKNRDKAAEIGAALADLDVEVRSLADYEGVPDVEETGDTFEANAALKAAAFARATGLLTIADDSGLCVDALGGAPGVYSARFAGPGGTYADNNRKLLAELAGVPAAGRGARFVSVIACATPDGAIVCTVRGEVEGRILDEPRGEGGFGYDPLFYYPPAQRTFAELPAAEKNCVSHRARALAAFRDAFAARRQPRV